MTTPHNIGLSFGTPKSTTGITGITFGTPSTIVAGTGFGLGSSTATTTSLTTVPSIANFALTSTVTPTAAAPALSFNAAKTSATTIASTGFSLTPTTAVTGFGLAAAVTPKSMPAPTTLSFGLNHMSGTGFGLSTAAVPTPISTATIPTFQLTGSVTPSAPATLGLSFDTSKTGITTTTTAGFPLATTTGGFSFGVGTTTNAATAFPLSKTTSAAIVPNVTAPAIHTSLGTATTVSSAASGVQLGSINFCQLEESINKWRLELEEQEKVFINQATQVNVWDKLLITNGEKIVTLNQEVERVKIEQQQLEHELDYVFGQQKELQECLMPLEKELASLSVSDPDREYTYRLSENLDTQLKRMSEDLKEIIEHLNEANRTQDSSDPIVQIGKILNAHMNSLQWIDQQTATLGQRIQQIDQMHQNFRHESEQNLHLAYN